MGAVQRGSVVGKMGKRGKISSLDNCQMKDIRSHEGTESSDREGCLDSQFIAEEKSARPPCFLANK